MMVRKPNTSFNYAHCSVLNSLQIINKIIKRLCLTLWGRRRLCSAVYLGFTSEELEEHDLQMRKIFKVRNSYSK